MSKPPTHWPVPKARSGTRPKPVSLLCDPATGGLDGESLVQYVLCARVDLLAERSADEHGRWIPLPGAALSRTELQKAAGAPEKMFWRQCQYLPDRKLSDVTDLEARLIAFAHSARNMSAKTVRTMGWLTAFATEMLPGAQHDPTAAVLGRWLPDLADRGPTGSAEAIVLGEALLAQLAGTSHDAAQALWEHNKERADLVARGLVAVATRPPGGGAMVAVQLGALLGEPILPLVREHLQHSPVGFRAMRFVQRMFQISVEPRTWWSEHAALEIGEARNTLRFAHMNAARFPDPYPARSLFLEAVRASLPPSMAKDDPWYSHAISMIRGRLEDPTRPARERAYAAHALWDLGELGASLNRLVETGTSSGRGAFLAALFPAARPGALNELLLDPVALDALGRPEIDLVNRTIAAQRVVPVPPKLTKGRGPRVATPSLGFIARLPSAIQDATAALVRIALLSPDGTARSRACDALHEALVTDEAVGVISAVINDPGCAPWLQEIGAFVLGQLGNSRAVEILTSLAADPQRRPGVRHAALWALGDLRVENDRSILDTAESVLVASLADRHHPHNVTAAAVYALGVTDQTEDRSGLMRFIASPSYRATESGAAAPAYVPLLARWGLDTRERIAARSIGLDERMLWGSGPNDLTQLGR